MSMPPTISRRMLLAAFWLYVTIPLCWGVYNTILQATKLFQ